MGPVEALCELVDRRPGYVLGSSRLSLSNHRENSTWTHVEQEIFHQGRHEQLLFRVRPLAMLQRLKQLQHQMCYGVQVLHTGICLVGKALHLDEVDGEVAHFVPHMQHYVDLLQKNE